MVSVPRNRPEPMNQRGDVLGAPQDTDRQGRREGFLGEATALD